MLHPRDGRAVFALPWEGVTIVGTTDVDHDEDMWTEPAITPAEFGYIFESLRHAFPHLDLDEKDARATYSGVRGVIDTGARDPSKESREHVLWEESGLLTVAGGKLTTFRVMALQALRAAKKQLPALKSLRQSDRILNDLGAEPLPPGLDPALQVRLLGRHGADTKLVLAASNETERTERIADTNVLWSELRFAARDEAVVHLEDLLLRRARLGLLAERGGAGEMARIRKVAQPELGWDDATWEREEAAYLRTWETRYGSSPRGH
jgi:glycerol-3-phosphate dehydrogenase